MFNNITYLLLDAARMGDDMNIAKELEKSYDSLYRGGKEATLASVAPYIFRFTYGQPLCNWMLHRGWGQSWGVMIKSQLPLPELHKHFRKFLMVQTEGGKKLYFRFYDPRVLRIFLPTCDPAQIRELFGPINYFIMEDADPAFAIRFWHENGILKSDRFEATKLIEALPIPQVRESGDLPPETIAALKEQGLLEEVLAARGESTETASQPSQPVKPVVVPDPAAATAFQETAAADQKPNTKWKMFD